MQQAKIGDGNLLRNMKPIGFPTGTVVVVGKHFERQRIMHKQNLVGC